MHLNKYTCPQDNPDITEERKKATFDTDEMAYVIWDGKEAALRRREISKKVAQIEAFKDPINTNFMTREQRYENSARKIKAISDRIYDLVDDPSNGLDMFHLVNEVIGNEGHPLALHSVMFLPALQAQADDEQQEWWLGKALRREIIGTYAQTEMGHGTNLKKLETTATFDKKTQEFILLTPKITSLKWWPGNLGKSSNHAIVTATLMMDGKNYGPHNFFVQLRDLETHEPLKGISVGDIGPKMEYNNVDNGFLKLDNVRIPRRHMLMRHAKVLEDGTYVKPQHAKIAYSAMIHVRSHMIAHQGIFMSYALTTAIRYGAVRRQGEIEQGKGEVKILDYQTQQHRLFAQLARSFAFMFCGYRTRNIYFRVSKGLSKGQNNAAELADLHAITSGLKSVVTYLAGQGIEQARMSCGGHGYSMASGIPTVWGVAIGGCTYEGENMVMLLQLARYLMKAAHAAQTGKPLATLIDYLGKPEEKFSSIGRAENSDYSHHLKAFEHIARKQIFKAYNRLVSLQQRGYTKERAWNENAVEMTRASRLHTRLYIADSFHKHLATVVDQRVSKVLRDLLHLHLNYELLDMSYYLLEDNYLSSSQLDSIKEDIYRLLAVIRPNAVSLVDSFDYTDTELRSVLGRKDGHVYENLFKWAQQSELNRTDVLPVFHKYLKPMMDEAKQQSKL